MLIAEDSKNLFGSSKLPWARERISSKFIDSKGRTVKISTDLEFTITAASKSRLTERDIQENPLGQPLISLTSFLVTNSG